MLLAGVITIVYSVFYFYFVFPLFLIIYFAFRCNKFPPCIQLSVQILEILKQEYTYEGRKKL